MKKIPLFLEISVTIKKIYFRVFRASSFRVLFVKMQNDRALLLLAEWEIFAEQNRGQDFVEQVEQELHALNVYADIELAKVGECTFNFFSWAEENFWPNLVITDGRVTLPSNSREQLEKDIQKSSVDWQYVSTLLDI